MIWSLWSQGFANLQPLVLEIRPDPLIVAAWIVVHVCALLILLFVAWPMPVRLLLLTWVLGSLVCGWHKLTLRAPQSVVALRNDKHGWWAVRGDGRCEQAHIKARLVCAPCVMLQFAKGTLHRELVCVTHRSSEADLFRRLRVMLRG